MVRGKRAARPSDPVMVARQFLALWDWHFFRNFDETQIYRESATLAAT
jgi:hypothetical protein